MERLKLIFRFLNELYAISEKVYTYKYLNHLNYFYFRRRLKNSKIITASGFSKKDAEQKAARKLLEILK